MDRRKVIVIAAALIAVLGAGVVFMYVKGADGRADQKFAAQQVLVAKAQINQGQTIADAEKAGLLESKAVTSSSVVPGAIASAAQIGSKQVALGTIYPGEQILTSKFGSTADASGSGLDVKNGNVAITVQADDTARVAGFVNPGDHVAIFVSEGSATEATDNAKDGTRVLLPDVQVVAVGSTTSVSTTKTDASGAQTTEQLPKTLFTLSLDQADAQKVIYATTGGQKTLTFALLNKDSTINKSLAPTNMSNLFS